MKPRHKEAFKTDAIATLSLYHIGRDTPFEKLTTRQVMDLIHAADQCRYQVPSHYKKNRPMMFLELMQRRADMKET